MASFKIWSVCALKVRYPKKNHPPLLPHQFIPYKASNACLSYLEYPAIKKLVIPAILSRSGGGGEVIRDQSTEEVNDKAGL